MTETVVGVALTQTAGSVQIALTTFIIVFPLLVASVFFLILWDRPYVLLENMERLKYVGALRQSSRFTKVTTKTADLEEQVTVVGNPDRFQLLFKAASANWKKSTKAMDVGEGCIVQATTEQLNPDGSLSVSEALVFVPGVEIGKDDSGDGRHLRPKGQLT